MKIFKELYTYREFFKTSVKKEFRGKYKKSFLGVLWSFINPLLQLLVYALVFPFILKQNTDNYVIFLIVALIPWNFFITTVTQSTNSIVSASGIIKKVYFPREILPLSIVTSNLINFLISCVIIVAALFISGMGVSIHILWLPVIILLQYILLLGISFFLSSVTVYIRDLEYFINVLMMLWFYVTPIVYSMDLFPERFRGLLNLNPMVPIINGYRDILYNQVSPDLPLLGLLFIGCMVLLVIGYLIFQKCEKRFAEEL